VVLRKVDDLRVTAELSAVWRADNKVPALPKFLKIVRKEFTGIARLFNAPSARRPQRSLCFRNGLE
jgi:hypothetical protein